MNEVVEISRILSDLIAFPSVSDRSNHDIANYVAEFLRAHGVESRLIPNAERTKTSVFASIGPSDRPGIVLSAHTDVVPAEEPEWSGDPFTMAIRDGRAYGRGTSDMKGFLAAVLAHVPHWRAAPLRHPVHLAFSYDEEVGCLGAPDLAAAAAGLLPRPALCIVGEPTGLEVVTAHKGKNAFRVVVSGRSGHSAMPQEAANAVEHAAALVAELVALGRSYREAGPHDASFSPSWSTVHVGSIHGGTALNIVPDHCELQFEIRDLPGHDVSGDIGRLRRFTENQVEELQRTAPESAIEWDKISSYPPFTPPDDPRLIEFVSALAKTKGPPGTVSFGTEAGIYARAGIPTVVCGPGDIARAHKADEFIRLDELASCDAFLERLTAALCNGLPM